MELFSFCFHWYKIEAVLIEACQLTDAN